MGPEMLIPLLVAGGGAALQMKAQREAANERRDVLNRQMQRNDAATDKNIAMVQDEGKNFGAQARLQGLQDQEQRAFTQSQQDLQGAGGAPAATATSQDAGNVSDDFVKARADRAITEGNRMTAVARELAKMRAPGMLGNEDALRRANLASNLQNLWGTTSNMGRATGLDAQNVTEPWYGALGKVASAVGPALAGAKLGGGASLDPTSVNYENAMDRASDAATAARRSGIQFATR